MFFKATSKKKLINFLDSRYNILLNLPKIAIFLIPKEVLITKKNNSIYDNNIQNYFTVFIMLKNNCYTYKIYRTSIEKLFIQFFFISIGFYGFNHCW